MHVKLNARPRIRGKDNMKIQRPRRSMVGSILGRISLFREEFAKKIYRQSFYKNGKIEGYPMTG